VRSRGVSPEYRAAGAIGFSSGRLKRHAKASAQHINCQCSGTWVFSAEVSPSVLNTFRRWAFRPGARLPLLAMCLLTLAISVSGIRFVYSHQHASGDAEVSTVAGSVSLAEHLIEDHGSAPANGMHTHESGMFSHAPAVAGSLIETIAIESHPPYDQHPLLVLPERRPELLLRPPTA